jgi:hypothetical protein
VNPAKLTEGLNYTLSASIGTAAKRAANTTFTGTGNRNITARKLKNYALNMTLPTW